MDLEFEWDENKAQLNIEKHKISFDEAKTVFYDLLANRQKEREILAIFCCLIFLIIDRS
jgi:uncharacterized DUF497 family protein